MNTLTMTDIITLLEAAGYEHKVELTGYNVDDEWVEDYYVHINSPNDTGLSCQCFHPTPYEAYKCVWHGYINGTLV